MAPTEEIGLSGGQLLANGLGVCIWDLVRNPPETVDKPRLWIFAAWLMGDFLHLFGLILSGHILTHQYGLYSIIAAIETPDKYPELTKRGERRPVTHTLAQLFGVGPPLRMPPGDNSLVDLQMKRQRKRVDEMNTRRAARSTIFFWRKWPVRPRTVRSAVWNFWFQLAGLAVCVVITVGAWFVAVYRVRDTLPVASEMQMPHNTPTIIAYVMGWAGMVCWISPRFYSMYESYQKKEREVFAQGITTASILIGCLTHGLNVGSIMIINRSSESLMAQSPYLVTAFGSIFFDLFLRLPLKRRYSDKAYLLPEQDCSILVPPSRYIWAYDPTTAAALAESADVEKGHRDSHNANHEPSTAEIKEYNEYLHAYLVRHGLLNIGLAGHVAPERLPHETQDEFEDRRCIVTAVLRWYRKYYESELQLKQDIHVRLHDKHDAIRANRKKVIALADKHADESDPDERDRIHHKMTRLEDEHTRLQNELKPIVNTRALGPDDAQRIRKRHAELTENGRPLQDEALDARREVADRHARDFERKHGYPIPLPDAARHGSLHLEPFSSSAEESTSGGERARGHHGSSTDEEAAAHTSSDGERSRSDDDGHELLREKKSTGRRALRAVQRKAGRAPSMFKRSRNDGGRSSREASN
ncbi:hypothetical protein Rhopal_007651-T1 [Rhodotorula paludigena]|uniref:Uncharacterized protein n=1 Tax=Rhodotorula paludigena TaxID=86838 RepID=A0AAV5H1G0_9BASI|nr:hypothetical protein Rhopal_007651-T1 [Rhodotorula paludigena]